MDAVNAGPDLAELLVAIGMAVVGLAGIRPFVHAYVARFNRRTLLPADAGRRSPRLGGSPLPAGLSPEPAGTELAVHPETSRGQQAVETPTPDSVSTAPGEER